MEHLQESVLSASSHRATESVGFTVVMQKYAAKAPEGWKTAGEIAESLGVAETTARRALQRAGVRRVQVHGAWYYEP